MLIPKRERGEESLFVGFLYFYWIHKYNLIRLRWKANQIRWIGPKNLACATKSGEVRRTSPLSRGFQNQQEMQLWGFQTLICLEGRGEAPGCLPEGEAGPHAQMGRRDSSESGEGWAKGLFTVPSTCMGEWAKSSMLQPSLKAAVPLNSHPPRAWCAKYRSWLQRHSFSNKFIISDRTVKHTGQ